MTPQPPTPQQRADVSARLEDVVNAIKSHPEWQPPPNQNATLYMVWDFVMRSNYMLSEYDNIKDGKALTYPDQFRPAPGSGETAAVKVFSDVCGRTMMLQMLVNNSSGQGPDVDFGDGAKNAVKALQDACPTEHVMAGVMG